jgi:hypothetical protein
MAERDYGKEYRDYHGEPEQIKKRAQRNAARRQMGKEGRVHKGDGKEVDHSKTPIRRGGSNAKSNLGVTSESNNLGWRAGKKGYD